MPAALISRDKALARMNEPAVFRRQRDHVHASLAMALARPLA